MMNFHKNEYPMPNSTKTLLELFPSSILHIQTYRQTFGVLGVMKRGEQSKTEGKKNYSDTKTIPSFQYAVL